MTDYDLRASIRVVMDETDLASPDEIATKVAAGIPRDQLRAVLVLTLKAFVHAEMTRIRPRLRGAGLDSPAADSAKVRAIREAAPRWMRERVFVGTDWRLLSDCTYENLLFLVQDRMTHAAQNQAAADRYQRIADAVKRHKVSRVADLPKTALTRLESVAA
jgi:hypothetical protein